MEEEVGKLAGLLEGMENSVNHLDKILLGNGQPGLLDRQARVEEVVESLTKDIEKLKDMVAALTTSVGELKKMISDHIADRELHSVRGLFLKKEIVPWVVLAFLLLHEFVPSIDLLEFVKKLFGIP